MKIASENTRTIAVLPVIKYYFFYLAVFEKRSRSITLNTRDCVEVQTLAK